MYSVVRLPPFPLFLRVSKVLGCWASLPRRNVLFIQQRNNQSGKVIAPSNILCSPDPVPISSISVYQRQAFCSPILSGWPAYPVCAYIVPRGYRGKVLPTAELAFASKYLGLSHTSVRPPGAFLENASKTVVLICLNRELAEAQRSILEEHGYRVLIASDLRDLERVSKEIRLACVVLGEDIGDAMKHTIATLLSGNLLGIAIVEECRNSPVLPDADHVPAGDPSALLAALDDLLLPYGKRHTAHLQTKARAIVQLVQEVRQRAKYAVHQSRQLRSHSIKSRNNNKDEQHSG